VCGPVSCGFPLPPSIFATRKVGHHPSLLLPVHCYVACGVLISLLLVYVSLISSRLYSCGIDPVPRCVSYFHHCLVGLHPCRSCIECCRAYRIGEMCRQNLFVGCSFCLCIYCCFSGCWCFRRCDFFPYLLSRSHFRKAPAPYIRSWDQPLSCRYVTPCVDMLRLRGSRGYLCE